MAAAQDPCRAGRTRDIEVALKRIDTGEFGWCEVRSAKRLELGPTLTRCVTRTC